SRGAHLSPFSRRADSGRRRSQATPEVVTRGCARALAPNIPDQSIRSASVASSKHHPHVLIRLILPRSLSPHGRTATFRTISGSVLESTHRPGHRTLAGSVRRSAPHT